MKKYLKGLLCITLMLLLLMPVFAEDEEVKTYEYFDFKVERIDGQNIKNTNISIYASLEGEETDLIERTSEFNFEEVMWSVCVDVNCATSEEVSDEAVFEEGKDYILMVRITANNGADINVWGTDKAKYNGTLIENLSGEFGNTGKELMIKTRTNTDIASKEELIPTELPDPVPPVEDEYSCVLYYGTFCCKTFLGIPYCIWIIIGIVVVIILIVLLIIKIIKKNKQAKNVEENKI